VIVVATDGSPSAGAAARVAAELARANGEELLFVTVWRELRGDFGLPYLNLLAPDVRDIEREWAEKVTADAAKLAQAHGVRARSLVRHGDAAEEICAVAREEEASLIVLGSHGWGPVAGTLVGSALRGVLSSAPCPVLVSPPQFSAPPAQ
jgi:nucleotide-binding universal stress UspA family protein